MKQKVLFIATVLRGHLLAFHLPYMQWFQQQGYEVHCCAGNDTGAEPPVVPYCDRYIEIDFKREPLQRANRKAYKQLKTLIDQEHYALIHCHTPVGAMLGRLAARKARRHGTRVCYTAHGFHFFTDAPIKYWLLYYTAERYLAHFTDLLITINREDYDRARHFAAKKVELVNGVGVDLALYSKKADRSAIRKQLGVNDDTPVFITVGEHIERKNHAVCIRALAALPDAVLVLCGIGQQEEMLRTLAQKLGISDRVLFLGYCSNIAQLLQAADVFVFPSLHEGLPVALMEAMAAGLPCVVSRVRGNSDLIVNNEGGYLYQPHDVDGFARGMEALSKDALLRTQFGDHNRNEVQKYSLPSVRIRMTELYREQLKLRGDA
ncbi:MAG TPA: glycosyltransferase family 4 protein [Candidatus Limiplasma sp.]|nr:glycosyltransferase family 4 protein [Candidatus Limiplasma sp.]